MSKKLGIIGLGRCGMPAAEKFIKAGYQVFGHARRPEVIARFEELGGIHVESPEQVAARAETVIILVLNDVQVFEVVSGPRGVLKSAKPGSFVICMSTINRNNLETIAEQCRERQVKFTDCPFTGGPARITAGTLTIIAAGPPALLEEVRPTLEVIGRLSVMGDTPGMAQAAKHCNQLLVTAIHGATIELIVLAQKSGIDPKKVCDVVGSGIAGNDYFRLLSTAILEQTNSPGGTGQLWKDVNIVVNSARDHNLPLLIASAASQYFNMAVAQGMHDEDSARLIEVLQKMIE